MTSITYRDKVANFLKARPGIWIDGMTLSQVGGMYAWRSRVSDARRDLGLTIENRQRREGRRVISEYRLVEPSVPVQQGLDLEPQVVRPFHRIDGPTAACHSSHQRRSVLALNTGQVGQMGILP